MERTTVHLSALPDQVHRAAVAINVDVETGLTSGSLTHAALDLHCPSGTAWTFRPPADPSIRAMVITELYRHGVGGNPMWKLRALARAGRMGSTALLGPMESTSNDQTSNR